MKGCADCDVDRRRFLAGSGAVLSGILAGSSRFVGDLLAQETSSPKGGAKAVIQLWMTGGPSQLETFDPKPGTPTGGELRAIDTAVKGVRISETLPRLAKEMNKLAVVRSLSHKFGDHNLGTFHLQTGQRFVDSADAVPAVGAYFSHELGKGETIPKYVTIGSTSYGSSFLGHEHAPFQIGDPKAVLGMIKTLKSGRDRFSLMDRIQKEYVRTHSDEAHATRQATRRRIFDLLDSAFIKAVDLSQETGELKEAYGEGGFGHGCLMARRLVEAGARFVQVELGGWDTHVDNFNGVRGLCQQLDPAFATLLRDLESRGLLKETLVLWMGEFGRTPDVNLNNGRDHFPDITPVVLAGGPIGGGRVVGETDPGGQRIVTRPLRVPDLFATLYSACGINPSKKFFDSLGKLVKITDEGRPIKDLL